MNTNNYLVELRGYVAKVRALTQEQAIILVQAEAIKKARDYELVNVSIV